MVPVTVPPPAMVDGEMLNPAGEALSCGGYTVKACDADVPL